MHKQVDRQRDGRINGCFARRAFCPIQPAVEQASSSGEKFKRAVATAVRDDRHHDEQNDRHDGATADNEQVSKDGADHCRDQKERTHPGKARSQ